MGKEKKKSDWDDLQDLLSSSQLANDWDADAVSDVSDAKATNDDEDCAAVQEETNDLNADAPIAKKTTVKTKKSASGEKKVKTTKSRKKTTKRADAIAVALENASNAADSPETETVDVAVGSGAKNEDGTKKRRRSTPKKVDDEGELVKNVLRLEKENKAKKRVRAQKDDEECAFAGLLSQIGRIAENDDASTSDEIEDVVAETENEAERAASNDVAQVETAREDASADSFVFDDFFADSNVEELEISWGKPAKAESAPAEPEARPVVEASEPIDPEVAVDAVFEAPRDDFRGERRPRRGERDERDRRRNRRDRDERRNRRDDAEPVAERVVAEPTRADAELSVDLNDLDAFFATSGDEGVGFGFAPRREKKSAAPTEQPPRRRETSERPAKAIVEPIAEPIDAIVEPSFAASNEEDDERSPRNKRRRRRNGRRGFDDEGESPRAEIAVDVDEIAAEPKSERSSDFDAESEREPEARRERRRDDGDGRLRRRERRPRREREDVDSDATDETTEERRVLPSWSDAIAYVVRFNMSRRTNRRRN